MIAIVEQNGTKLTFNEAGVYPALLVENNTGADSVIFQTQSADNPATVRVRETATIKALVFDENDVQVYPAP